MRGHICFVFNLLLIQSVVCTDSHLQKLERIVEKLQDTVLSVSTENAKYKKMIEDLTEKDIDQEKRLENLEKKFKKDDNFFPEMKSDKTGVVQNLSNDHPFVEGLDAKKTMPLVRNLRKTPSRRVATPGHGKTYFFSSHFFTLFLVTSENDEIDFFYSIHLMKSREKKRTITFP